MSGFVIAVDGPAASGKGTIATMLGRQFGLPVLDTGLLYRAVGVTLMRQGGDLDDEQAAAAVARGLNARCLSDPAFRGAVKLFIPRHWSRHPSSQRERACESHPTPLRRIRENQE